MALPNITEGQIALDPVNKIFYYIDINGNLVNSTLKILQESTSLITAEDDLSLSGNVTILGETTLIQSTVTNLSDPIITLGGNTALAVNDFKDRGVEFRWHDGTSSKVGFFGFDSSSGKFTFIPDAQNDSEIFSGQIGEINAVLDWNNVSNKPSLVNSITGTPNEINVDSSTGNIIISLPSTINVNITGSAAGWTNPRRITLAGDLEGNVVIDGSSNVTLSANIVSNAVALGTDTSGDYIANLNAGVGITITSLSGESSIPTVAVTSNTYDAFGAAVSAQSNAALDASTKANTAYNNATVYTDNALNSFGVANLANVQINSSIANSYLKYTGTGINWVNEKVELGSETTGDYVGQILAGNGIIVSNGVGQGLNAIISANVALSDITNVNVPSPSDGQLLAYESNTGKWIAKSTVDLTIPTGVQYSEIIGNGEDTEFTVTHGLTTDNPFVVVLKKNVNDNFEAIAALWEISSNTTVKVTFETPPESGSVKVIVFGDVATASVIVSSLSQLSDVLTSSASPGDVLYRDGQYWISKSYQLNDISDVQISNSISNNHFLKFNGTYWTNSSVNEVAALNDLNDVSITTPLQGQTIQYLDGEWKNSTSVTSEPMGFENKHDSVLSISERVVTIAPVSASYSVWCKGVLYKKNGTESVTISDTTGTHYIYFNSSGVLSSKTTFFDLQNDTPVAYVYRDQPGNANHLFADERHGIVLDWATHEYLHRTRGAAIASGFGANNYVTDGNGTSNSHIQIDIANGTFFDEDLKVEITHSATPAINTWQQVLQGGAEIPAFYRVGINRWVKDAATKFPLKQGTSLPRYNLNTGGSWSVVDVSNNGFGVSWILATNNLNEPIIAILGTESYGSKAAAEASFYENLDLSGFPVVEFRPLYKIVYECKTTYTNTPKARLVGVYDIRKISSDSTGILSQPVSHHGTMTGLENNDHPQYLLVADHDTRDHSNALSTAILADLSDVSNTAPSTGQYLKWNGSSWAPEDISNNSITTQLISNGAVTSEKIFSNTIVDSNISPSANIAATKVAGTAITAADTGTVTSTILANNSVTQEKIADRAVGSAELDNLTLNAQTGTTYTLVLADAHKLITLNNASPISLTVPTDVSVNFDVGDQVNLLQLGAGQVTVGGAGVNIRSESSKLKLTGQYAVATLIKIAVNEWVLVGNLAA